MGKKRKPEPATKAPADDDASAAPLKPQARIEELEGQVAELESRCLRAQADYKNLRRRTLSDLESSLQLHMQPLLEELLFVLDFLDMALASPAEVAETKNLVLGVQMTRDRFAAALENSNVEEIPTSGIFDPKLHDATESRAEAGVEAGTILSTVRRGFTWQGRVLRPAQVVVVADESAPSQAAETDRDPAESSTE